MGKPKGTYVTLEAPNMMEEDEEYHKEISVELARIIRELVPLEQKDMSLLVVGLGNREVTPDALGPNVVDQLFVTRHMIREFGTYALGEEHTNQISGIVPGVMAQTGMESLEIVQGVAKETKPDCIFVIDALAARSVKRLNRAHYRSQMRGSIRIRCRKPQKRDQQRKHRGTGDRNRSAHGGRCGNDRE